MRNGNEDTNPNEYRHMSMHTNNDSNNNESLYQLDWQLTLDASRWYQLEWTVKYSENEIIFALNIDREKSNFRPGYDVFALGLSSDGRLESSDYCLIWYDLGHRVHLQDAQTNSNNTLKLIDANESVCKFVSSFPDSPESSSAHHSHQYHHHNHLQKERSMELRKESDSNIQIVFTRPLDVCTAPLDTYYKIDNGTSHLVWFTLKGPLLSIDGLNLTSLMALLRNGSDIIGGGRSKLTQETTSQVEKIDAKSDLANQDSELATGKRLHNDTTTINHGHHEIQDNDFTRQPNGGRGGERLFEFGMKRVQLISGSKRPPTDKQGNFMTGRSLSHDIRMEKFEVPARETSYQCKLFKLPHKFETKRYHITKYEAVIEAGNEHVVHHMELFNCANLNPRQSKDLDQLFQSGGWSGDCSGLDRPKATEPCRKVVLAWAMGAQPLVYPEQVGQSIGGQGYSPYVVLEVHYNNVNSVGGLVDNSGLRFHYTNKLRPFDAGILEVGLEYTDKNSIPPRMVTPLASYCSGECTRVAMAMEKGKREGGDGSRKLASNYSSNIDVQREGIYVFAAQLHTHLTGVASWTEQIREGKLVRELQRDDHYSPHFQEIRLLPEPINIQPGDSLVHYCLYDTTSRVNITLGGYSTSDEMCVTYLHYYPRIELEVCKSSVDSQALAQYFAYLAREERQNTSSNNKERSEGKSVSENYRSIEWSARRSRELIRFYSDAPLSIQCNQSDGSRYPGHWNGIRRPQLWPESNTAAASAPLSEMEMDSERSIDEFNQNQIESLGGALVGAQEDLATRRLVAYRGRGYKQRHERCRQRKWE